jgi:hypothetical protein
LQEQVEKNEGALISDSMQGGGDSVQAANLAAKYRSDSELKAKWSTMVEKFQFGATHGSH